MCLAVPSKIVRIRDARAMVEVDGVRRETSLALLDDVAVGDYVIVHAGFAIQKLDEDAAKETLALMRRAIQSDHD